VHLSAVLLLAVSLAEEEVLVAEALVAACRAVEALPVAGKI
jgi:hypothetical protein